MRVARSPGAQKPLVTIRGLDAGGARRAWWGDAAGSSGLAARGPYCLGCGPALRSRPRRILRRPPTRRAATVRETLFSVASRRPVLGSPCGGTIDSCASPFTRIVRARCGRRRKGPSRPGAKQRPATEPIRTTSGKAGGPGDAHTVRATTRKSGSQTTSDCVMRRQEVAGASAVILDERRVVGESGNSNTTALVTASSAWIRTTAATSRSPRARSARCCSSNIRRTAAVVRRISP
jgi:hypothetical protein